MLSAGRQQTADGWTERRDTRYKVIIPGKLRAGSVPVDVCIRDVSARGICAVSTSPPARGTFVELIGAPMPIVGRVMWTNELRFGIEVRGRLDVSAFLAGRGDANPIIEQVAKPAYANDAAKPARSAEANRHLGQLLQYVVFVSIAAGAAFGAAQFVYEILSGASSKIESAL